MPRFDQTQRAEIRHLVEETINMRLGGKRPVSTDDVTDIIMSTLDSLGLNQKTISQLRKLV